MKLMLSRDQIMRFRLLHFDNLERPLGYKLMHVFFWASTHNFELG